MAKYIGFDSMDALVDATVPTDIRRTTTMDMGKWTKPLSESEFLDNFKTMASKNQVGSMDASLTFVGLALSLYNLPQLKPAVAAATLPAVAADITHIDSPYVFQIYKFYNL